MSARQVLFRYRYAEPVPRRAEAIGKLGRGLTMHEVDHTKPYVGDQKDNQHRRFSESLDHSPRSQTHRGEVRFGAEDYRCAVVVVAIV